MVGEVKQFNRTVLQHRKAFTMIELIFAIVVVGFTMLTIPLMIQTNNKALERTLAGEAIFLASAVAAAATTTVWDDNSILDLDTDYDDISMLTKILDVGGVANVGTGGFYRTSTAPHVLPVRVGGVNESMHRQFFDYNASAGAANAGLTLPAQTGLGTLDIEIDGSASNISGYKQAYDVHVERMYVPDGSGVFAVGSGAISNLKMTKVTIPVNFDANDPYDVVFRIYTANIGESDYEKRSF